MLCSSEFFPDDIFQDHLQYCQQDNLQEEYVIDDSVEYSECPICLQKMPQDCLMVHASECGI